MLLNLQTPVGSDFLKDWPGQNAVNNGLIDDAAGACLTTHPIQSYVPVLSAATTPPNLGTTGTIQGWYYRIFDQVYTWGEFIFGTGFSAGTGILEVTLPFKAKVLTEVANNLPSYPVAVGNATAFDASSSPDRQPMLTVIRNTTKVAFTVRMGTGGASRTCQAGVPFTFAIGDGIMWSARYERDIF
jgi:hypothetical protein